MSDSTLLAIRTKIRRLTRSPSASQISDADIDEYVNTFIQYDFPEHLRLFSLRETLTFYTDPNVDTYETNTIPDDPLNNFKNKYITVHEPVYIAGFQAQLSQARAEFFGWYPFNNSIVTESQGNGAQVVFTGTLTDTPVLRNNVVIASIDANNNGLRLSDNGNGSFEGDIGIGPNAIDYETGQFSVTFSTAPGSGEDVVSETVPYVPAQPRSVLYFNNKFVVRPVPDKVYPIQMEVDRRPSELLNAGESPELEQWWQYIAVMSARKVFEDRSDPDSVAMIMPLIREQQLLVLRRTIVTQTKERTATIYTEQLGVGPRYNFGQNGF